MRTLPSERALGPLGAEPELAAKPANVPASAVDARGEGAREQQHRPPAAGNDGELRAALRASEAAAPREPARLEAAAPHAAVPPAAGDARAAASPAERRPAWSWDHADASPEAEDVDEARPRSSLEHQARAQHGARQSGPSSERAREMVGCSAADRAGAYAMQHGHRPDPAWEHAAPQPAGARRGVATPPNLKRLELLEASLGPPSAHAAHAAASLGPPAGSMPPAGASAAPRRAQYGFPHAPPRLSAARVPAPHLDTTHNGDFSRGFRRLSELFSVPPRESARVPPHPELLTAVVGASMAVLAKPYGGGLEPAGVPRSHASAEPAVVVPRGLRRSSASAAALRYAGPSDERMIQ